MSAGRLGVGLDLGALSETALSALTTFVTGLFEGGALVGGVATGGAVAALGVLFIPSTGPRGKWVEVGGRGDVSYYVNPDEAVLRLKYTTLDNVQHILAASPSPGGDYRGPDGRVIARLVKTGAKTGIVVATAELVGSGSDDPQACPAPIEERGTELGRDYEDFAKALFNPGHPTPRGWVYGFINPSTGNLVKIDDCQQQSGALAEYKGPGYLKHFLDKDFLWSNMYEELVDQSFRQERAKGTRSLTWYVEERPFADYLERLFKEPGTMRPDIVVKWLPWPGKPR